MKLVLARNKNASKENLAGEPPSESAKFAPEIRV
jgi:hypothetical protein